MPDALRSIAGTEPSLQSIIEDSPPGPFMVRRLAQLAVMHERGLSIPALAKRVSVSREQMYLYFQGKAPGFKAEDYEARREDFEDHVEAQIETYSAEVGFEVPRVCRIVGPPDETGLPDVEFNENAVVHHVLEREAIYS